jgi:hypothetical protein
MEIQQVKAAKTQLDNDIAKLLNKFSGDTGLAVEYINIQDLLKMGGPVTYVVSTDVKLP